MVSVEAGGNTLRRRGMIEEITSELFDGELVVRHVLIEGIYHPISPQPHRTVIVFLVAVCIRIPRGVQPR